MKHLFKIYAFSIPAVMLSLAAYTVAKTASRNVERKTASQCEQLAASLFDASVDGTDELTVAEFCSEYQTSECKLATKLSCDLN